MKSNDFFWYFVIVTVILSSWVVGFISLGEEGRKNASHHALKLH